MEVIDSHSFRADRAWGSRLLLDTGDHAARMHWTDQPYRWHDNTGDELFVVLDGVVEMHHLEGGKEQVHVLCAGQMALIAAGERHVAHPRGQARILVIERKDSD